MPLLIESSQTFWVRAAQKSDSDIKKRLKYKVLIFQATDNND